MNIVQAIRETFWATSDGQKLHAWEREWRRRKLQRKLFARLIGAKKTKRGPCPDWLIGTNYALPFYTNDYKCTRRWEHEERTYYEKDGRKVVQMCVKLPDRGSYGGHVIFPLGHLRLEIVEDMPEELQNGVFYLSRHWDIAIHLCPCGCRNKVVTPLSQGEWKLTERAEGTHHFSLYPSIQNTFACYSHYWIRDNQVIWV